MEPPASCMCNFQARPFSDVCGCKDWVVLPVPDWHPCWVGWWPCSGDPPDRAAPEPALEAPWWSLVSSALADASSGQICSEDYKSNISETTKAKLLSVFPFKAWGFTSYPPSFHKKWPNQNLSTLPQKYPWLITVVLIERGGQPTLSSCWSAKCLCFSIYYFFSQLYIFDAQKQLIYFKELRNKHHKILSG